jgi:hypothetical protein
MSRPTEIDILNETGEILVGSWLERKPGEIIEGVYFEGLSRKIENPLCVIRLATKAEFDAQHMLLTGEDQKQYANISWTYYYAVSTD